MEPAPLLTTVSGREQLRNFYRDSLLQDTIPFWFPRSVDEEHGGFRHCLDRDGSCIDSDKSVWAQGRMCWMLLTLYNSNISSPQKQDWLEWARCGLEFIENHCVDSDGRMFFHVTQDGRPIRKRRYAYSEAFASIAHAAYFQATGDQRSRQRAVELFEFFTRWNFTPGLMPPKYSGTRPMIGLAPRMITLVTAQELRCSLGPSPWLTQWIDRSIDEIRHFFIKPELRAVLESVAPNGDVVDHFDGRTLNPGHAMEAAWFILREGRFRQNPELIGVGCQMVDWMWEWAWDKEFGGVYYFRDVLNKPPQEYWHDMKFWWPHNETIIATLMAYLLTQDEKYSRWHQFVHEWSHRHFHDPVHGEWFGYLHRDGSPSSTTKGNLWKSCFHLPRMQRVCWQLLDEKIAQEND
ncbi:MAG: AGE family epimerase/isomerase [Pirellula sp.]